MIYNMKYRFHSEVGNMNYDAIWVASSFILEFTDNYFSIQTGG